LVNDVVTKNFRRAASGDEKCGEHLDHRGFAGTIRTEQTEEFTPINAKCYTVDSDYFFCLPADNADVCLVYSSQIFYFDRIQITPFGPDSICL